MFLGSTRWRDDGMDVNSAEVRWAGRGMESYTCEVAAQSPRAWCLEARSRMFRREGARQLVLEHRPTDVEDGMVFDVRLQWSGRKASEGGTRCFGRKRMCFSQW